jgi:hypothetical protein
LSFKIALDKELRRNANNLNIPLPFFVQFLLERINLNRKTDKSISNYIKVPLSSMSN